MDWDDLRHFLALARLGSVRSAGAALGVSHSTVARRVDALEARLAVRLFDRHRDGYDLTAAGQQLLPGAERIARELDALERGLLGQDERLAGTVRITCSDAHVAALILAALAPFCRAHPDIALSLNTDPRPLDLDRREADMALRALAIHQPPPPHLIGRRVAPVILASYVATAHAARLDPAQPHTRWLSFADRALHAALVATSSHPHLPAWGAFSSPEVLVQAAREGMGLVMLPTYMGDRLPDLQRLSQADLRHVGDLWLLSHPDLRENARFRAVRERIAAAFQAQAPLFRGEDVLPSSP